MQERSLPARVFRLKDGKSNNNPPAGDLKDNFWYTPTVDLYIGGTETIRLVVLVVLPPVAEIPIF
jgi:hypothetical protein